MTEQKKAGRKTAEKEPLEAELHEYRKPLRPTKALLAKQPFAVVMLAWWPEGFGDDPDKPADRDFEPFDNDKDAKEYFGYQLEWTEEDLKPENSNGVLRHATILVSNTAEPDNLSIDKLEIRGGDAKWRSAVRKHITENKPVIFSQTRRERVQHVADVQVKAKPQGKAANAAAPKKAEPDPIAPKAKAVNRPKPKPEYSDAQLLAMSAEEVAALPSNIKGHAAALRMKAKREARAAEAAAAVPPKPKPRPRVEVKKQAPAAKPKRQKVSASAFVKAG